MRPWLWISWRGGSTTARWNRWSAPWRLPATPAVGPPGGANVVALTHTIDRLAAGEDWEDLSDAPAEPGPTFRGIMEALRQASAFITSRPPAGGLPGAEAQGVWNTPADSVLWTVWPGGRAVLWGHIWNARPGDRLAMCEEVKDYLHGLGWVRDLTRFS